MKKFFLLLLISSSLISGYTQSFDSTDYRIIHLQDSIVSGTTLLYFEMTTNNNNTNTGYSDFTFIHQNGDTITWPTNWSMWLPEADNAAIDTTSYLLYYNVGINSFPTDFNGYLKIRNPDFTIPFNYSTLSTQNLIIPDNGIRIFPNPFTNEIQIINESQTKLTEIKVFNSAGLLILTENQNLNSIEMHSAEKGVYIVKFFSDGKVIGTQKIIKT